MELESDFFALFGLERSISIDLPVLKSRARKLLVKYHPDKMVQATSHEKRLAEQFTAHVNHARSVLEDRLGRASHLLALLGIEVNFDNRTIDDKAFLVKQMMLREELEETNSQSDINSLEITVDEELEQIESSFAVLDFYGKVADDQVQQLTLDLAKMYFFSKFKQDIVLRKKQIDR